MVSLSCFRIQSWATRWGLRQRAFRFQTHPTRYQHWQLQFPPEFEGRVAQLVLTVKEDGGLRSGYPLKLNSYDLGVDIELADALMRLRFEHTDVRALVITAGKDRVFCSGANIYMLGSSTHGFKVNFCKFTNETRLYLEEMSAESGIPSLAALNGTASGGGYELALACDEIVLRDDGSSAVSFPEAPLLGVLPGTGGLTRLVDKRKVRRDLADVFSTLAEGVRGKRAIEWNLVEEAPAKAQFDAVVKRRLETLARHSGRRKGEAIELPNLEFERSETGMRGKYVALAIEGRTATLNVQGPDAKQPRTSDEFARVGAEAWAVRAFRELDAVLLELRFNAPVVGVVCH